MFKNRKTPITDAGLRKLDHLTPTEAVLKAWTDPGNAPDWHSSMRYDLHDTMPLLARALDRMAREGR